jgi:serine/threonine protein kinase
MLFHPIHPAHETNPFVKACFPFCTVSPITLRPGKEDVGLTSSFTMTGNVSSGTFCTAEVAIDASGRTVVLKRVTDSARKDSVRNLNKERVLLDHLTRFAPHENIIKTVRCSTLGEDVLVLEHGGANLVDFLEATRAKVGQLDMASKLRIGRQMVSAVAHLHASHMCHRDLKIDNVTIDPTTQVIKIIDLGLAAMTRTSSGRHVLFSDPVGNLLAAPEVVHLRAPSVKGTYCGMKSDSWSLGAMLYSVFVGHPPFYMVSSKDVGYMALYRHQAARQPIEVLSCIGGTQEIFAAYFGARTMDIPVHVCRLIDLLMHIHPAMRMRVVGDNAHIFDFASSMTPTMLSLERA